MDLGLRLLGPVELLRDGRPIAAGGPTQRAVLAMLGARGGRPVGVDELVAGIWGESEEPGGGGRSLKTHVSRLRSVLGNGDRSLRTVPGGYRLDAATIAIDAIDFERLLAEAHRQRVSDDPRLAAATLEQALLLWAGPALMDLRDFPFAGPVVARLEELRAGALEDRVAARLAAGEDAVLVAELRELVAEFPYRERLHGQLMIALYRAGQQVAALDAYRVARGRLLLDLGVEPGPELERLHCEILQRADVLKPQPEEPLERDDRPRAALPRRELPTPPALFGRDDQLADLERLVGAARLVTLTGAGGSGKTALALALLHRLAASFRDGAVVVDLGAVAQPDQVLPAIAAALGMSQRVEPLGAQLAAHLAEHRVLLLLDSLEHLLDAAGQLDPLVSASGGWTVATSRTPLGLADEVVVDVPPLDVPAPGDSLEQMRSRPAVQLFLRAAMAAGGRVDHSGEEIAHVGRLCAAVDGLPLAIQIVAAQTRAETPAELVAHLDERLLGFQSRTRDAPARQRTMDAAIGWSVEQLAPDQCAGLSRLSVFAGSFSARGASSVLGLSREQTIGILTALLDASLLTRSATVADQARFRMLQPVRVVARSRVGPALAVEAAARHAAFIAAEVDRLCPRPTGIQREADLRLLRAEYPDVMAALRYLATTQPERCIELADQLDDFWRWTGREVEAGRLAQEVLGGGTLSTRATFLALGMTGMSAFLRGQPDEMRSGLDRMLAIAEELRDNTIIALARLREAEFALMLGEPERARVAARAAVEQARPAGELHVVALALATRALAELGRPDALAVAQEALDMAERGSMAYPALMAMASKAIVLEPNGRIAEAMSVNRAVLELAGRFGALESASLPASNLAGNLLQFWLVADARRVVLPALVAADRAGHRVWVAAVVESLAHVEAARGCWAEALTLMTWARAATEQMGMAGLWSPGERARLERMERWLSELLGQPAAAAAIARGRELKYGELVDYALNLAREPTPESSVPAAAREDATSSPVA